jgi:uncharacterized protein (TIGR02466 family)
MAKVNKISIFTNSILQTNISDPTLDKKILQILKKEEKKKEKVIRSNKGGFHSSSIKDKKIIQTFLKKAGDTISSSYKFQNNTTINLQNLWIIKNKKNHWNMPHTHPNTNFSGVYYVKVPKKGGELIFIRNDATCGFSHNYNFINNTDTHDFCTFKPEQGLLLIFPSYFLHMVAPHNENEDRVSVSFNVVFTHDN